MENANHPEISDLRRIRSLSEFSNEQLASLANKLEIQIASKNETIMEYGCSDDHSLYLLVGQLEAITQDKRTTLFEASDEGELNPIAKIRPSMYQVVARGPARYLENLVRSSYRVRTTTGERERADGRSRD